jgi:molecular chaperone GrpE
MQNTGYPGAHLLAAVVARRSVRHGLDEEEDEMMRGTSTAGRLATPRDYQAALRRALQHAAEYEEKYVQAEAAARQAREQTEQAAEARTTERLRDFAARLLDVADNLERALRYTTDDNPLAQGVQATLQQLYTTLRQEGIEPLDVQPGAAFDPRWHEAVEVVEAPAGGSAEATVQAVQQQGYTAAGQLLRPARVVVARPPAAPQQARRAIRPAYI